MWFEKVLKKIFRKNSVCDKCKSPSQGKLLCEKCQEYVDDVELKKENEIKVKKELKRRNWIKIRDEFLDNKNG